MIYLFVKIIIFLFIVIIFCLLAPYSNRRHKRYIATSHRVLEKIATFEGSNREARILGYLRKINPYVFEELLLTSLEKQEFKIQRNKSYSGDGGVDGRATLNGRLYLIQAKRYKNYVSTKHLEEFQQKIGDGNGLFIHTGKTGKATFEKYRNTNLEIISGNRLIKLIENSYGNKQ